MRTYRVKKTGSPPALDAPWDSSAWKDVQTASIDNYRSEGSDHKPLVGLKLQYGDDGFYGLYKVNDRYVRCTRTQFQDPVAKDSCVEFFVKPREDRKEYINFEFNCGGTLLCNYVEDPTREIVGTKLGPLKKRTPLKPEDVSNVKIYHSMPDVVEPEISEDVEWRLGFFIPFSIFETCFGALGPIPGQRWRANFYKCGDETSHPHWISWNPLKTLNFHQPDCFGTIEFEEV